MAKKILVVDDSALVRKQLGDLFDKNGYDVGFAKDGQEAIEFALAVDFDVITMDINMPVLDGLSAVKEIMRLKPTPIVMVSSLTQDEAEVTFDALDLGAVDYVAKPGTMTLNIKAQEADILQKVKTASLIAKNRLVIRKKATDKKVEILNKPKETQKKSFHADESKIVLVGASTGGPGLIEEISLSLPSDYPYPVCVVQHMPDSFTANFAARLNRSSNLNVLESESGMALERGMFVIAKGGWHLHFVKKVSGHISLKHIPNTINHFFCPSVDEMFLSAAKTLNPSNVLAVLLTGIGDDGANGMVELKKKGAYTIGESPETAVVYGMPKEAFDRGGVVKQLPFSKIVQEILRYGRE